MRPLDYIANARLPTEKAHGAQIAQMCDAFARAGARVDLVYPNRRNTAALANRGFHEYYGVSASVKATPVACIDWLTGSDAGLRRRAAPWTFRLLTASLVRSLRRHYAHSDGSGCIYTRSFQVADAMRRWTAKPVFLEVHALQDNVASARWESRVLHECDGAIALTQRMRAMMIERGLEPGAVVVEPDAVDLDRFPGRVSREEARDALGLREDGPIFGYVGKFHTLDHEKGIPDIVRAAPAVLAARPTARFLFVGGPLEHAIGYRRLIASLGLDETRFDFRDHQPFDEMHLWHGACDVLLMPLPEHPYFSRFMSPMKMFEYMASNRPIVASSIESVREVLADGCNALLPPPGDPAELARAMLRLLEDKALAEALARRARSHVQHYTWRRRADRILDFIALRLGEGAGHAAS